jgi:hypothetical protein
MRRLNLVVIRVLSCTQMTVLDTLIQASPDAKLNDLKQLLGRMLFSGSAMDKKV